MAPALSRTLWTSSFPPAATSTVAICNDRSTSIRDVASKAQIAFIRRQPEMG
jgi:hypothetical protein